mmetsp:Transcript_14721/g.44170  ORF Transcript_14721/g.44170 Transcript_14721/m.44170 type:complete len:295 (-) Transcript_14721:796-1680(-)
MIRLFCLKMKPLPAMAFTSARMSYWAFRTSVRRYQSSVNSTECCKARLIVPTSGLSEMAESMKLWTSWHAATSPFSCSPSSQVEESTGMACSVSRASAIDTRRSPRSPSCGSWSRKHAAHCRSWASSEPRSPCSCAARRQRASSAAASCTHFGSSSSSLSMMRCCIVRRSAVSTGSSPLKGMIEDSPPQRLSMWSIVGPALRPRVGPALVSHMLIEPSSQRLAAICCSISASFMDLICFFRFSMRLFWKSFSSFRKTCGSNFKMASWASSRRFQYGFSPSSSESEKSQSQPSFL